MDGPIFDAMLKTALEEALRQDMEELEKTPEIRQSRRQKRRMRQMLADPWSYARRQAAAPEKAPARRRNPARWAAVVVVAALLTGTAAGYALRGGDFFQRMFDASPWAARYGGAADTEQLLDMGSDALGAVAADETLRLELVDAVSDGQFAMAAVRLTVLDQTVLEEMGMDFPQFLETDISKVSGDPGDEGIKSYGVSVRPWRDETGPAEGQYLLVFSISSRDLSDGGVYRIDLQDLGVFGEDGYQVLSPGTWAMEVSLRPGKAAALYPEIACELGGADWVLEKLTCSALALRMEFRGPEAAEVSFRDMDMGLDISLRMRDGRIIGKEDYVRGISGSPEHMDVTLEFQMPINVEEIESVTVCGQEIFFEES